MWRMDYWRLLKEYGGDEGEKKFEEFVYVGWNIYCGVVVSKWGVFMKVILLNVVCGYEIVGKIVRNKFMIYNLWRLKKLLM